MLGLYSCHILDNILDVIVTERAPYLDSTEQLLFCVIISIILFSDKAEVIKLRHANALILARRCIVLCNLSAVRLFFVSRECCRRRSGNARYIRCLFTITCSVHSPFPGIDNLNHVIHDPHFSFQQFGQVYILFPQMSCQAAQVQMLGI